jgi:hypothetical protein
MQQLGLLAGPAAAKMGTVGLRRQAPMQGQGQGQGEARPLLLPRPAAEAKPALVLRLTAQQVTAASRAAQLG